MRPLSDSIVGGNVLVVKAQMRSMMLTPFPCNTAAMARVISAGVVLLGEALGPSSESRERLRLILARICAATPAAPGVLGVCM